MYLLHQFNSDHTSYRTDHVDALLDEGIKAGLFDKMIVVIPNSSENSWWTGEWEKMITEELIPLIDGKYRTINDPRYRLTVGCSMGGQGAYAVALRNPDYFTGAVSFFGAFSFGAENSPNAIASKEPVEYLKSYALYFICGNQDSYGFGAPAIQLHQQRTSWVSPTAPSLKTAATTARSMCPSSRRVWLTPAPTCTIENLGPTKTCSSCS